MAIRGKVGGDYETPESGLHKARCIKIIDKGTHFNEKFGNSQRELNIMFELPELEMKKGENKGKPFAISLGFGGSITLSMSTKSNLRPKIESWLGKKFNDKEAAEFDIDSLLGKPALINIMHTQKDDNTYANVDAVMPLKEGECPDAVNPLVLFSLSDFDQARFDSLPEKTRKRIEESDEWEFRFNGGGGEIAKAEARASKNDAPDVSEDEIPFSQPDNEIADDTEPKTDDRLFDFEEALKALPKKTWSSITELCCRKMGESDYNDYFMLNDYGKPTGTFSPEAQATIAKELITVCKARE